MHVENSLKLDYKDVLIRPKRSSLRSRKDVVLERSYNFKHSNKSYSGIPIIASNMDGVGTFEMFRALKPFKLMTCIHKFVTLDSWREQCLSVDDADAIAVSSGTGEDDFYRVKGILEQYPFLRFLCIDVANGYSEHFVDFIKEVRSHYPDISIMAGNVVTADMTQELIMSGADIVKVGIGPGSVCTTRIQTGVGYPQLSAVMECADAAHGLRGHIVADGGCTCPGDVSKAFGAGADFVMLGGVLAGHDEGGGERIDRFKRAEFKSCADGEEWISEPSVLFYGMSSETAQMRYEGKMANYRSSEGRTIEVPYRGPVELTVRDILGGIRSTCTYVGAPRLKDLSRCTTFIRCSQQYNAMYE